MKLSLKVVEIFNSIQGEGGNVGRSATFIRLSGCNKKCSFCDTDWEIGTEMTLDEIRVEIQKYKTRFIIWTGGEPTLQLNNDVLGFFEDYYHGIETNGTNPVPSKIDYISCSPKVDIQVLNSNLKAVNEFRFPVAVGDKLPFIDSLPVADNYFLSPIFDGEPQDKMILNRPNLDYCLSVIEEEPRWRLSMQLHKLLQVK